MQAPELQQNVLNPNTKPTPQMSSRKNMVKSFVTDCSESSEVTTTTAASTLPPSEIISLSPGMHASETDQEYRRKNAYKWFKILAKPTRETMCQIAQYTKGSDFTRQDVDLLRWNFEETDVAEEAMQSSKHFTAVMIVEEDGVRDHVNICAVSKEEDDDCASHYELDGDDEGSFAEEDQEPAPSDEVATVRVPEEDVNLYSQEYQRTKREIEKREKLEVGSLNDSLMDLSRYHSPTRNAKKFYAPLTIGKINCPGIFNFEAEEDPVESSSRIVNKNSGHATSRDFISNVAATPFIRPYARRHSLMTAKDIEGESITTDDFQTNPIISPRKFHRGSVGLTSRPGLPSLSIFNNDNRNTKSDQAQVDEEDYGYSISHSSRYSVSKDEDDDCASFYDLDEGDEDSFAEADQEPASSDEFAAVRAPEEDMNLYSQEYQRTKKEIERREKLEVGSLNDSLMDLSIYQSPTRNAKKFYGPATIGKINSPGIFNFEAEEDPVDSAKKMREKKAHMNSPRPMMMRGTAFANDDDTADDDEEAVSKPVHSMRPGMIRGRSYADRPESSTLISSPRPGRRRGTAFDNDSDDDDTADDDEEAVSKPVHNMRPGMIRGRSYVEDGTRSLRPGRRRGTAFDNDSDGNDNDNDNDDEEAVSKPVHNMRPGMIRGRSYVEDGTRSLCPGRRRGTAFDNDSDDNDDDASDDDEEAVSKPVHNMRPGMIRGRSYVDRPESSTLISSPRPGRRRGTALNSDDDDDDDSDEEAVSKPVHSMRPGMIRGRSYVEDGTRSLRPGRRRGTAFDNDSDDNDDDDNTAGDDEEAVSKPVHNMRPGALRGRSYVEDNPRPESSALRISSIRRPSFDSDDASEKPQKVKDDEEKKAKVGLVKLLDQDSNHKKAPIFLKAHSSLRKGYISAVDKLRPQSKPFLVQTKDDLKKEAKKVKKYDDLKNAWDTYEDTAQDKPDRQDLTLEEEAAEEKVIEVETAVNRDWLENAEEVVKGVQNNDGSEEKSEGDEESDFWILEAKQLEAEAERKKAKEEKKREKSEKKKMRKEEERQQKRLEADHGNSVLLKEETRKKKESERKAKSSKTKESNVDSTDTENVGKAESGVDKEERTRRKEERRQKREEAKSKNTSAEDVKETVLDTRDDACRRQLAFSWYLQMSSPDRLEFKRKIATLHSLIITPDDVDLLPWNATGSVVNIAEMNTLTQASLA